MIRAMTYVIITLPVFLLVAIFYGLFTHPITVAAVLFTLFAVPALIGVIKLMSWLLTMDGVRTITISPTGLKLVGSRGFGRHRIEILPADQIDRITTLAKSAKPRVSLPRTWWLEVAVIAGERSIDLGWLTMDNKNDPNPTRAARMIADRLNVPLIPKGVP